MKKLVAAEPIKNPAARVLILGAASGLGLGYTPKAPGTAGSLLGIPLGLYLLTIPTWMALLILFALFVPSCWIAGRAGLHWGNRDSGRIVLDEVIGQAITLLGLRGLYLHAGGYIENFDWIFVALAFGAFRILDIVKPFPAKSFDRQATGFGVMTDDVVAGLYGALIVRALVKIHLS